MANGNLIGDPTGDAFKGLKVMTGDVALVKGTLVVATGMAAAVAVATSQTANSVSAVFATGDVTFTGTGTDAFYYVIIGK